MVDVEFEPTIQKNHGLSTTPFVKVLGGVLVRLTTCKRLTNSLPILIIPVNTLPSTGIAPFVVLRHCR